MLIHICDPKGIRTNVRSSLNNYNKADLFPAQGGQNIRFLQYGIYLNPINIFTIFCAIRLISRKIILSPQCADIQL
jgi:hypothetical protein